MPNSLQKMTEAARDIFLAALGTKAIADFVAATKAASDTDSGTFKFTISTEDEDRQGEVVNQAGLKFDRYKLNPVVLWGHDYYALPIGVCTNIYQETKGGKTVTVAEGKFAPEDANPFAQQVRRLYDLGMVNTCSVGFIPLQIEGNVITEAELLEFSIVPVPANPFAMSMRQVETARLDLVGLAAKGMRFTIKGAIPYADHGKADEGEAWDAGKEVADAGDDLAKLRQMCAWVDSEHEDTKSAYKLPHHRASDLAAVWEGVAAAMGALLGARGGVEIPEGDRQAVYSHLAKHYADFGKEAPEFKEKQAAQEGDSCTLEDGTPGVFDAEGNCIPVEVKDSAADEGAETEDPATDPLEGEEDQDLVSQLRGEMDTHAGNTVKAIETYCKDSGTDVPGLTQAMADEHARHATAMVQCVKDILAGSGQADDGADAEKSGRRISSSTRSALKAALDHYEGLYKGIKAGNAMISKLLEDGQTEGGEERSNPSPDGAAEFQKFMADRSLLKAMVTALNQALAKLPRQR